MRNIKTQLNLNEVPFKPGGPIVAMLRASAAAVNRYPEWDAMTLRSALADHYGVDADWIVVSGAGSIGLIQQAMVASGQGEIIYSWPSFEAFDLAAGALRMPIRHVGLMNNACDLQAYNSALNEHTSMVIVCTPNAPTGGIVRQQELESFIKQVPKQVLILVDEAYGEFVDADASIDALGLVKKYANVMVTRTFSKAYGLAGVRVGYAIAQPQLALQVIKAGLPFPVPAPFQAAVLAALADRQRLDKQVSRINEERHRLANKLRSLGVEVVDGYGNFVWLPVADKAAAVAQTLQEQGVLVKPVMPYGVRITVGTAKDTDAVYAAWQQADLTNVIYPAPEASPVVETTPDLLQSQQLPA